MKKTLGKALFNVMYLPFLRGGHTNFNSYAYFAFLKHHINPTFPILSRLFNSRFVTSAFCIAFNEHLEIFVSALFFSLYHIRNESWIINDSRGYRIALNDLFFNNFLDRRRGY